MNQLQAAAKAKELGVENAPRVAKMAVCEKEASKTDLEELSRMSLSPRPKFVKDA